MEEQSFDESQNIGVEPLAIVWEEENGDFTYEPECSQCGHNESFQTSRENLRKEDVEDFVTLTCPECRHSWAFEPPRELPITVPTSEV